MTAFNAMSHGTQDMYQTFLGEQRGLGVSQKAAIGIIYSFGAICGGQSWDTCRKDSGGGALSSRLRPVGFS